MFFSICLLPQGGLLYVLPVNCLCMLLFGCVPWCFLHIALGSPLCMALWFHGF